jgi:hypothetical protein
MKSSIQKNIYDQNHKSHKTINDTKNFDNCKWIETERYRMYPSITIDGGWRKSPSYLTEDVKRPRKRRRIS